MLIVLVGVASGCPLPAGQCQSSNECRSDELCLAAHCRRVCNANNGCLGTETCVDGVCLPAGDGGGADRQAADRALADRAPVDRTTADLVHADQNALDRPDAAVPPEAASDSRVDDAAFPDAGVDAAQPPLPAIGIATGYTHSCAIIDTGAVKCWGANASGQLGLGDTLTRGTQPYHMGMRLPAVDLGARQLSRIVAGQAHTCLLMLDGNVLCWGDNAHGQLGMGDLEDRGDESGEMGAALSQVHLADGLAVSELAAGANHNCAILEGPIVKCWGDNRLGQLGLGDILSRGGAIDDMNSSLPAIDVGREASGPLTPMHIATGLNHTCVLSVLGAVKCWGDNDYGQLGLGDILARGPLPGQLGDALPTLDLGGPAVAIAAGAFHTCALLDDGAIKCWGDNQAGQLGVGDTVRRGGLPNQMGGNLPAAMVLPVNSIVLELVVASLHSCALVEGNELYCWGANYSGQLGLGDTQNRGGNSTELPLPMTQLGWPSAVGAIAIAGEHSCALGSRGQVKCWGQASSGELGLGDTGNRGDGAGEMSDALPVIDLGSR